MAEITKPIILDDTGKSIATANARTAAALESIAQILADGDGGGGEGGGSGADGFSPIARVVQTSTGATITITDKNGTTTAEIANGPKGDTGPAGSDAAVTSANIASALGYTPANPADIPVVTNDFTNAYKDRVDTLWGDYQSAVVALG